VSVTCPHGHESVATDYCDQCGALIGAADRVSDPDPDPGPSPEGAGNDETTERADPITKVLCPVCRTPTAGNDAFCEACGHDFAATPTIGTWEAVVTADRAHYERMATDIAVFPTDSLPRVFRFDGPEVLIGRRSASRGILPEIDLSGAPEDPCVSHRHALLVRAPDGSYVLVDPGSANGTWLNDDLDPVALNEPVPLADGDRLHLGAWTCITVRRPAPDELIDSRPG
jgi:FHA domain